MDSDRIAFVCVGHWHVDAVFHKDYGWSVWCMGLKPGAQQLVVWVKNKDEAETIRDSLVSLIRDAMMGDERICIFRQMRKTHHRPPCHTDAHHNPFP